MTKDFKNIDTLLNEHTARQLSTVDWDRLYDSIQKKLDAAEKQQPISSIRSNRPRWAVGISAAAAILLVVFIFIDKDEQPLTLKPGQRAAVQLSESQSIGKTEIGNPVASVSITLHSSQTRVQFESPDVHIVQCDVSIVDRNGQMEKGEDPRSSWIIMMASKPDTSQSQTEKDQLDIACML